MPVSAAQLDAALAFADDHLPQSLDRLRELIRIKSISTDPAYAEECKRAAGAQRATTYECRYVCKDGSSRWLAKPTGGLPN